MDPSNPYHFLSILAGVAAAALIAGCAPAAGEAKGPPKGPFAVSDYFAASGAMGDGATPPRLSIDEKNSACKQPRPAGARGNCFAFSYDPRLSTSVTPSVAPVMWAGLYWQYPANNWGKEPGLSLPAGLSKVTFQAALGEGESDMADFAAGGIGFPKSEDPNQPNYPHDDSFRAPLTVGLNDQWTRLEIPLNATPTELLGAFTWSLHYDDSDPSHAVTKTLYIDDLFYE